MKRILCYIGILAAVLVWPVERLDVGKLCPVQVVSVYKKDNWVVIETDTEDIGFGATARQALENLEDTTSGVIYLDTAQYLLLSKDAEDAVEDLRDELKPSVQLCFTTQAVNLQEAAVFLATHGKLPELKAWKTGQELPVLSTFGKRLTFLKKVEKRS